MALTKNFMWLFKVTWSRSRRETGMGVWGVSALATLSPSTAGGLVSLLLEGLFAVENVGAAFGHMSMFRGSYTSRRGGQRWMWNAPRQERWVFHACSGLGWQKAGFMSNKRWKVEEGAAVRYGQRRDLRRSLQGQWVCPSYTACGLSVSSALVCLEAIWFQAHTLSRSGQEAEAGSAASCVQWCVALFLGEDQVEILQNSKCIRLVWGKLKLKECEKLGSSWKMVKSSAFQRASSFLQLWVLPQPLRMPKAQLFLCSLQGISSQDFKAFTVSQSLCLLCRWSSAFRTSIENKVPNTGHWVIL